MELTYEEKLQLDNSIEHLRVVQGNLRIASEELSNTLRLIEQARTDLSKSYQDREIVIKLSNETWDKANIKVNELNSREESIVSRENKIDEREKEVDKRVSQATDKLNKIDKDIKISSSNYLKTVDAQNIALINLQYKLESTQSQIKNNEEDIKEQSSIKTKQENEIVGLTNQIKEAQKGLSKFLFDAEDKMTEITQSIEDEKDKIKNPLELVKREQDKLDKLKNDLGIIRTRLTAQFERQNPRGILPIELQEN